MEPDNAPVRAPAPKEQWHEFTLYIDTADPLTMLGDLDRIFEPWQQRGKVFAFYNGDIFPGPSLEAFEVALTEQVARQRAKMAPTSANPPNRVSEVGETGGTSDKTPQEEAWDEMLDLERRTMEKG